MNTAISATHTDAAFFRNRQAMLVYPVIIIPFLIALFWILGGGKGERYLAEETAANQEGAGGFNAKMPNAKGGHIDDRGVEAAGFGKASGGQMLSSFTNTRHDSVTHGLKAIPVGNQSTVSSPEHASSLATAPVMTPTPGATGRSYSARYSSQNNAAALAATRSAGPRAARGGYYYNAPDSKPYYTASATDQQLDRQLQQYESSRYSPAPIQRTSPVGITDLPAPAAVPERTASVQVSDNLAATRLAESSGTEEVFHTAPTGGSRRQPERAVLSGASSYGNKKTIAWMIPVVVHEDQTIKDGQQVKLRLLKEITADGVTIPVNTIMYAICKLSDDRLQLTVRNLQLHGQLIPLDLTVYDTDGAEGINVPGLTQSSQNNGQLRSSAIQGLNVPGIGGLASTVLSSARMSAANSARQTTIRLRAGYNLFLKA